RRSSDLVQTGINAGPWVKSSVSGNLIYNTIDDTKNPHYGIFANIGLEVAGLGGDAMIYKLTARGSVYHTIFEEMDIVGVLSAGAGLMSSFGSEGLRIFDHFKNNERMIRALLYYGIGPVASGTSGDHLGGTTYFHASAEAQFPLPLVPESLGLRGAVFADAATLYGSELDPADVMAGSDDMKWRAS